MDAASISQTPYSVLSFIAAPALLTNASTVLVLSTTNRMLAARERMLKVSAEFHTGKESPAQAKNLVEQVNRIERQARLLLHALLFIYLALGAFISATLVTLIGAGLALRVPDWYHLLAGLGLVLGAVGVASLVIACGHLYRSTQISLISLEHEAALIRERASSGLR